MNIDDIIKDLQEKTSDDIYNGYFQVKLFEDDDKIYGRRSFGDLYKYYSQFGVTEEKLLEALIKADMGGKICAQISKLVFCRIPMFKIVNKYLSYTSNGYFPNEDRYICDKYNITYMDELYNKINKED